jgi:hypothetical protein
MPGPGLGPAYIKRTVRVNSVRKGLLGGSRFWLTVFALGQVARFAGKVTKRGEMPVRYSETLGPGETLVIRHIDTSAGST